MDRKGDGVEDEKAFWKLNNVLNFMDNGDL